MKDFKLKMSLLTALIAVFCCAATATVDDQDAPGGKVIAPEGHLYIGWATADITPDRPVAVRGQMHLRIARKVNDPISCTALAIETRDGEQSVEQAVMVSCDLVGISDDVQAMVRERLAGKLEGFDLKKLFLNATHTHEAPVVGQTDRYDVPDGVMQPGEYRDFLVERVAEAVTEAWNGRKPGLTSWGLGHAVVGHNRRAHYQDGVTRMYGDVTRRDFDTIEGYEDHSVEMLFFWDGGKLTGVLINIACPSQETEKWYKISADFWHETRVELRKRYGKELFVFPQCAAAGDQTSHLLFRQAAEEEMLRRKGIHQRQEMAIRIADAVDEVFPYVKQTKDRVIFKHTVDNIKLPVRKEGATPLDMELHVIRLDEIAICTNPFELYLDYGVQMKARSKAALTMVSQLTCDMKGYLPTEKADAGGHYSTRNTLVAPEGGAELVNETLWRINEMWGS